MYPISIAEMRERYLQLYTGAVNDVLRFEHGLHASTLPAEFKPLRPEMKLAGLAFTVKGAPDLVTEGEFERRAEMLEALPEDSVVVWDCTGDRHTAQWGEVMTMAARQRGCRGAVVNGVRDTQAVLDQDFPVFHQYCISAGMLGRFRLYHWGHPVQMGEIIVRPGDWIFGDIDGLLSIPAPIAYDVLVSGERIVNKEVSIKDMVQRGLKPTDVVKQGGYF